MQGHAKSCWKCGGYHGLRDFQSENNQKAIEEQADYRGRKQYKNKNTRSKVGKVDQRKDDEGSANIAASGADSNVMYMMNGQWMCF